VPPPDSSGAVEPIKPILGDAQMEFFNPINQFKLAIRRTISSVEQFTNDVYYVVASAYDYASVTTKVKRLYWRTRMTVAAQGVSQEQTLPTLIVSAAPFFGKDMTSRKSSRRKPSRGHGRNRHADRRRDAGDVDGRREKIRAC